MYLTTGFTYYKTNQGSCRGACQPKENGISTEFSKINIMHLHIPLATSDSDSDLKFRMVIAYTIRVTL